MLLPGLLDYINTWPDLGVLALQADRADRKLAFLLKQADVFQHFAPEQKAAGEDKKKK